MGESIVNVNELASLLQSSVDRIAALEQVGVIPVGLVAWCPGAVFPGWLVLDGSAFDQNRYGRLYSYLGTATLPNVQGRVIVGQDAATFAVLGSVGGVEAVTLTSAQSGLPAHTHLDPYNTVVQTGSGGDLGAAGTYNQVLNRSMSANAAANAAASHTNLQPYIVMVPVIKF